MCFCEVECSRYGRGLFLYSYLSLEGLVFMCNWKYRKCKVIFDFYCFFRFLSCSYSILIKIK